jgi:phospholipid/cholesterol/gamma-HCH transport system permease protein
MSSLSETPPTPFADHALPPRPPRSKRGPLQVIHRALHNAGLIFKFTGYVVRDTFNGRVIVFIGETIRQAGILIVSSTIVIWGLIFIVGLQCGIEGAYLLQSQGAPQYSGLFSAWCDLRELAPLTFGYMMAAKVGTGIVAELGSMRISEEIDALEVMGISGITFLCATRLLASWLVLPFIYLGGVAWGFLASYIAVVSQVANVSSGGYSLIFWEFQNPGDLLFSMIKAMAMATVIVLVGCYYGYTASGGPVGVGVATAKSMVVNIVSVHVVGMLGTQLFWGANPRAPIGG